MVQLTIQVRAKTCYSNAGKIKTLSVDSSQRVEEIVERGSRLYRYGQELPLNSSFASNNVQNGDILESCSSPLMSALLSAVLKDLNDIDKIPEPERTKEKLEPLLGGAKLDPWPNRWSKDSIKSRIICLAYMKKVIQRNDRFAETVPKITTLQELYEFMKTEFSKNKSNGHNSMQHVFKPSAKNANNKPSTCWQMMEYKFLLAQRIRRDCANTGEDWIEVFVQRESNRHKSANTATPSSSSRRSRKTANATPQQPRRTLPTPQSSSSHRGGAAVAVQCSSAGCNQLAEYTCLEPGCPFHEQLTCTLCFLGNHPAHIRNHTRIPLTDPRVKAISKEKNKKGYCPEFQSGPYAILCCLLEASTEQRGDGRRELSLSESKLKKLAQKRCRSNLYDRQARGRSAFACIEGLADKQLVRKELIPNQQEARFSLMREGEAMARRCLDFERATEQVLKDNTVTKLQAPCPKNLVLLVDTREDANYSNRLQESCFDDGYPCEQRELPAGDYLFTQKATGGVDNEVVMPLVIERKSWSDFADSVHGAGRGHRRLDCVKIGGTGPCPNGRCQLCRMKRSGCEKVMFIIEGARCLNRDGEDKCDNTRRCQHCRELQERHNTIQEDLESIIYDLQTTHRCLIHFTRNYNDTIQSLKMIYRLLTSEHGGGPQQQDDNLQLAIQLSLGTTSPSPLRNTPKLTYNEFTSNARKYRTRPPLQNGSKRKDVKRVGTEAFIRGIREDRLITVISIGATANDTRRGQKDLNQSFAEAAAEGSPGAVELLDSDSEDEDTFQESQNSVEILEFLPSKKPASKVQCIDIDSDDDEVIEENVGKRQNCVFSTPGIFVVTGLYEYDRDFFKDINKIWQNLYRTKSNLSSDNFRKSVSDQLLAIQNGQLPLVHRDSILYWTLRIPLCENVLLHTARTSQCVNNLSSRLSNGRQFPSSGGRTLGTAESSSPRETGGRRAIARQQQDDDIVVIDDDEGPTNCRRDLFGNSSREQHSTPVVNQRGKAKRKGNIPNTLIYTIDDDEDDDLTVLQTATPRAAERAARQTPRQRTGTSQKSASNRGKPPRSARKTPPVYEIDPPAGNRTMGSGRKTTPTADIEYAGTKASARPLAPTPDVSILKRPPKYSAGYNAASRNLRPDPSLSNTDSAVREARLRRFGASESRTKNDNREWECNLCTFKNKVGYDQCKICGAMAGANKDVGQRAATLQNARVHGAVTPRPSTVSSPSRKRPRSHTTPSTWRCGNCTLENPLHLSSCKACDAGNPFNVRIRKENISSTATGPSMAVKPDKYISSPPPSTKRRIRCGACGLDGHNRGTATASNCPAYNKPEEVDLRNKKKEAARKKAKDAAESLKDFESRKEAKDMASEHCWQEMQRLMALQQQRDEENRRNSESELKRLKKAAERAEKQARRLDR